MRRVGPLDGSSLASMNGEVAAAADRLPSPFLDLVVYHCTSGSALGGDDLGEAIRSRTGVPTITTASAIMEALRAVAARNVCLVSPYTSALAALERETLERFEFSVVAEGGRPISDGEAIQQVPPAEIVSWTLVALAEAKDTVDAVLIACTGLRSPECVAQLERETGLPIVTSTTAMIRSVLTTLNSPGGDAK